MVNRLAFASLIAMSLYAITSHASEWKSIGTDDKGNIWAVDRASIVAEGNIVRSWTKIDFKEQQPYLPNGELIKHVLSVNVVNCDKNQIGVKASRLLRADGSVITAHEDTDSNIQWQTVAPDTVVEKTMSYVCANAKKTKMTKPWGPSRPTRRSIGLPKALLLSSTELPR